MNELIQLVLLDFPETVIIILSGLAWYNQPYRGRWKEIWIAIVIYLPISHMCTMANVPYNLKVLLFTGLGAILYYYIQRESVIQSLIGAVLTEIWLLITDNLVSWIVINITNNHFEEVYHSIFIRYTFAFLYFMLLSIPLIVFNLFRWDIMNVVPKSKRNMLLVFLITCGTLQVFSVLLLTITEFAGNYLPLPLANDWYLQLACLFLSGASVVLLIFYVRATIKHVEIETETPYVKNMADLVIMLKSVRHDATNHYKVIFELLKRSSKEAYNYVQTLVHDTEDITTIVRGLNDPEISVLLQSKKAECQLRDIKLKIDIHSEYQLKHLKPIDKVTILGNIIDNAIRASSEYAGQKIVSLEWVDDLDIDTLVIKNTGADIPDDVLENIFKLGTSTKNEIDHGVGLAIVKKMVDKYKGTVSIESKNGLITVKISIPKVEKTSR